MEIMVLKCDRCKKEVEGLIEFSFINRNIQEEDEKPKEEENVFDALWGLKNAMYKKNYPTVRGGLCLDCVQEISRWLGHPENILSNKM